MAVAGAALACEDAETPGSVDVTWRTGQLTCDEAGVVDVVTELYSYARAEPSYALTEPCGASRTSLDEVDPGDYTLVLRGLDADGCWTHEAREDVEVPEGDVLPFEAPLLRRQRPLWVRWPFANELDCQGNEVSQVEITIDVEDRYTWSDAFLCPGLAVEVPADVPSGDIVVHVVALDAQLDPIAYGRFADDEDIFTEEPCEDRIEVRVPLELCVTAGCESEID